MGKKLLTAVLATLMVLGISCSKDRVKTADGYWNLARESFNNRRYTESIETYQKLVNRFPEDSLAVRALFAIAEVYKNNLREYQRAIDTYRQILDKYPANPKSPNASFMIGYIYANDLDDMENAKASYEKFIEEYPDHMLVQSAEWEISNLGKALDEIPQLQAITKGQ
jgi:TolA-binding protein